MLSLALALAALLAVGSPLGLSFRPSLVLLALSAVLEVRLLG